MLEEENLSILRRPWNMETVGVTTNNYWLIQVAKGETTQDEIRKALNSLYLRYDTMAFAFVRRPGK